jgi:hypothetical protein
MPRESGKTAGKLSVDVEEIDMLLLKIDCREIKYKNMNVKHIVGMKELDGFLAKLPVGCSFYASCLRSGFVHSSGEVYARRNEIKAKFGVNSVNASVTPDDEVKFSVSEVFSSRDELLQFVEKNDMELPEDCRKTGFYSITTATGCQRSIAGSSRIPNTPSRATCRGRRKTKTTRTNGQRKTTNRDCGSVWVVIYNSVCKTSRIASRR